MFPLLLLLVAAYAALHVLFFHAVRSAFAPSWWMRQGLRCVLTVLFAAPLLTRTLDRIEHERIALLVGLPGYFCRC